MLEDVHAHADAREQFRGANLARAEPAILVSIDEQPRALSGRNLEHRSKSCAVGHAIIGKELERQHGYAASELLSSPARGSRWTKFHHARWSSNAGRRSDSLL